MHDRRSADRRTGRLALRWPDQRSGFDRRASGGAWLLSYRDGAAFPVVLVGIVVLSLTDIVLTLGALTAGAEELNPLVRYSIAASAVGTIAWKLALGAVVAVALWKLRHYRRALEGSLVAVAILGAVVGYQLLAIAAL